ncbi:uncharacterized protein LOC142329110 [Lycorma delicatula]|uniref:uncharacterized protein LOC142329110 n=1 Tax=Lycorma delicatula TaxID=130591 RepID=UPI003F5115CC
MNKEIEDNLKEAVIKNSSSNYVKGSSTSPRYYKQHYRKAWEQLPEFNGWLEAVPNNSSRAFCKICNKNLHAHRLTLLKHTASIKHMKRAQTQYKAKQLLEAAKISEPACNLNEPNVIVEVTDDRNELKVECNNINNSDNIKLPTETQTVSLTHGVSSDSSNNVQGLQKELTHIKRKLELYGIKSDRREG